MGIFSRRDKYGFDKNGMHKATGTRFNKDGFDKEGYDKEGYDKEGYDKYGYNKNGFDKDGKPAPAGVESFKKFSENPIIRGTSFKQRHPEIKKAYRRLSLKFHLDKNPNDDEAFFEKLYLYWAIPPRDN